MVQTVLAADDIDLGYPEVNVGLIPGPDYRRNVENQIET